MGFREDERNVEPLLKVFEMVLTVIETRVRCMFWDKSGGDLITGQTVTGVKVA